MAEYIEDNNAINDVAKGWGESTAAELRAKISSLGVKKSGKLLKAIKAKYHYEFGEIDRISFSVLRYGILVEKGVGRGVGMRNGARFSTVKNNSGTIKRLVKPWISESLTDESISKLADQIVKIKADSYIKTFKI